MMSCYRNHSSSPLNIFHNAKVTHLRGAGMAYWLALSALIMCHKNTQFQWIHHWILCNFVWFLYLLFCQLLFGCLELNSLFCYYCYQWLLDYLFYLDLQCQLCLHYTFGTFLPPVFCLCIAPHLLFYCVCRSIVLQLILRHLGLLCLTYLAKPNHSMALQRIHMFFAFYCIQMLLYICLIV